MNKEEIEELKDFTIDLTDIDELALGLEVCSKKSNMVIQEFADTIIQLQQENKILKENAEHNDKVVDKVNWENMLLKKENKQLKQKYEMQKDSNKLLCKAITCDDCNCKVCEAHKDNIELKKQLEEKENIVCNLKDSCLENAGKIEILENQQKEFIKYLEDEISKQKNDIFANALTSKDIDLYIMKIKLQKLEEILQKYKGDDK